MYQIIRRPPVAIMFVLLCTTVLSLWRFNDIPVGSFFDDAHYIVLARSLLQGEGYRLITYPSAPPETAFPPGWSLLLIPLTAVFPNNFTLLKLYSLFFWLGTLLLFYAWLRQKEVTQPRALSLLLILAISPNLVGMSTTVMSESAFLFFSLLTLLIFQKWQQQESKSVLLLTAALLTAVCALLIRTVGVALVGGLFLSLLIQYGRRRHLPRALAVGALVLIPVATFNAQNGGALIFSPLYKVHIDYVLSEIGRFLSVWQHLGDIRYETLAGAVVPLLDLEAVGRLITSTGQTAVSLIVLLLIALGWFITARKRESSEWYILFYMGIFYIWIVYIDEVQPRIMLPLIPFFLFYFFKAISTIANWLNPKQPKLAALLWPLALVGLFTFSAVRQAHAISTPLREGLVDLSIGASWVRDNAPQDAVVMTANAVPDALYAERLTIDYPRQREIATVLQEENVSYIIVRPPLSARGEAAQRLEPFAQERLLPFIESRPEQFYRHFYHPESNVSVYQVLGQ